MAGDEEVSRDPCLDEDFRSTGVVSGDFDVMLGRMITSGRAAVLAWRACARCFGAF
jgi:hypothetical protein